MPLEGCELFLGAWAQMWVWGAAGAQARGGRGTGLFEGKGLLGTGTQGRGGVGAEARLGVTDRETQERDTRRWRH